MSMVFALVLFGCADDGSACERLPAQAERYESKAACEASHEEALLSDIAMRSDYPLVVSRCLRMSVGANSKARPKLATR